MDIRVFKNCNGEIVTDSLQVAKEFNKRHTHTVRDIKKICPDLGASQKWIIPVEYKDKYGRTQTKYNLTKNGFMMLVMQWQGFIELKRDYIQEYSDMEQELIKINESNIKLGSMLLTHREKLQLTKELFYPILEQLGVLEGKKNKAHKKILSQVFGKYENINKLEKFSDEDIDNYKRLAKELSDNSDYFINKNQISIWELIEG